MIDFINSTVWQERAALVTQVLANHIGRANGIGEKALVLATGLTGRAIRSCIEQLRLEGRGICGKPNTGYFMAATAEELNETCEWMRSRGIKSLKQVSAMQRVAIADLIGQERLRT